MAITTNIGWTNSTASPWFICTEVSPGCANCYARLLTEQKFAFVSSDPAKPSGVKCYVKQHQKPGQQGRIPDHVWSMKEIPEV